MLKQAATCRNGYMAETVDSSEAAFKFLLEHNWIESLIKQKKFF